MAGMNIGAGAERGRSECDGPAFMERLTQPSGALRQGRR